VASSEAPIRLIVFDLDGTLIDSRRDLAESANALLQEHGWPAQSEEAIGRMVGDGAATLVARAFAAAGAPTPPGGLERFLELYESRLLKHTRTYDGVEVLLGRLAPRFRLAVLTNKPLGATRQILDGLKLAVYFGGNVLGGDGPLPRKPDPAGLRRLIEEAAVEPAEALLVGDSAVDWRTAQAAASRVCLAAYGFGFENFPTDQLRITDTVIHHPLELEAHL
jgi:phosphoglycolate phosphatase